MLNNLGRREEALAATREAVQLRRSLAGRNSAAFLPDLAKSLGLLGSILSAGEDNNEALAATDEAINKLWPFFERLPAAFEPLTKWLLDQARRLHEALQQPLPPELVERLATFERLTRTPP